MTTIAAAAEVLQQPSSSSVSSPPSSCVLSDFVSTLTEKGNESRLAALSPSLRKLLFSSACLVDVCLFLSVTEVVTFCSLTSKAIASIKGDFPWHLLILQTRVRKYWQVSQKSLLCCVSDRLGNIASLGRALLRAKLVSFPKHAVGGKKVRPAVKANSKAKDKAKANAKAATESAAEGLVGAFERLAVKDEGDGADAAVGQPQQCQQLCGSCSKCYLRVAALPNQGSSGTGSASGSVSSSLGSSVYSVACDVCDYSLVLRAKPCKGGEGDCANVTMQQCCLCSVDTETCKECGLKEGSCTVCLRGICDECSSYVDGKLVCDDCSCFCESCDDCFLSDDVVFCDVCCSQTCEVCYEGALCEHCGMQKCIECSNYFEFCSQCSTHTCESCLGDHICDDCDQPVCSHCGSHFGGE